MAGRPADAIPPELDKLERELQKQLGTTTLDRADVMTYAMFPQVALQFFKTRALGPAKLEAMEEQNAPTAGAQAAAGSSRYTVTVDGERYEVRRGASANGRSAIEVDGRSYEVTVDKQAERVTDAVTAAAPAKQGTAAVKAPMPGTVVKLLKADGAGVAENEPVLVMEALKMQMEIRSAAAGRIRYLVKEHASVRAEQILAEVS